MDERLILLSATSYSGGTPEKRVTSGHDGGLGDPLHTHTHTYLDRVPLLPNLCVLLHRYADPCYTTAEQSVTTGFAEGCARGVWVGVWGSQRTL